MFSVKVPKKFQSDNTENTLQTEINRRAFAFGKISIVNGH